jgi:uncharacterized protein DUF6502
VRSKIQDALLSALESILRPIVKLMLQSGISYSEFASVAKSVFVQVATADYKRRGRPANFSQVSAITGISRKEVSRMRKRESHERWTPSMEASPVNTVLHEWHFDPDFSDGAGNARALPFDGPHSFSTLVARYVGDIPPGAMRSTLQKAALVTQNSDGLLAVSQPFFYPRKFDEGFIRQLGFSMSNLGSTMVYNATLHQMPDLSDEKKARLSRLERGVWSEYLGEAGAARFKAWVDAAAPRFLEEANHVIGDAELPRSERGAKPPRAVGVGLYYYEEDQGPIGA